MNFQSDSYLPNSEEKIRYLRKVINGRPVAILAAGSSIAELESRIAEIAGLDVCYFGINRFVQETCILRQVSKQLSIFMLSSREGIPNEMENIISFLNRDEGNLFISSFWRNAYELVEKNYDINSFINEFDAKLLFFSLSYDRTVPNNTLPLHFVSGNSLQMAIQIAIIGKASKIILFGADGSCNDVVTQYYRSNYYNPSAESPTTLTLDTRLCFNPILPVAVRNTYKTYKLPPIDILNCSPDSRYTPFPIVSYDSAFEILSGNVSYDKRYDLRAPKLSVISSLTDIIEKDVLDRIQSQSYTNYEHILTRKEGDDIIPSDIGNYPNVRLADQMNNAWHQSMRNIVTASRGEYLTFSAGTDYYVNPDWFNICVDILDNHSNISLVWGLTQHISANNGAPGYIENYNFLYTPPPQGKAFKHFWKRNPMVFPAGNLCVRKEIFEQCFPAMANDIEDEKEAWQSFTYNFITSGSEPFFVPLIANYHRTFIDQGGHRPEGEGEAMHLAYYAPVLKDVDGDLIPDATIKKLQEMAVKPHILIVSEKWCDCNPAGGNSNSEHNIWGSLATSGLATYDLIHFDEYHYFNKGNPDGALLDLYKVKRPDLVFISWLATTDCRANPSFKILDIIRSFGTPIAAIFWDSANPANMEIAESVSPHIDLILLADSTTAYLNHAKRVEKYLPIWTPQDTNIFNNPNYTRDIDVCFLGSLNTHPERKLAISALMANNIKVHIGGGQREQFVSVEEYAEMFKRSKIVLNFSRHAYGYHQHKGRVFEATLCGALLFESENPETEKWFTPMLDYVPFNGEADLVNKVIYFLAHDYERQKIADCGCAKATELYTGETFWSTVLARLVRHRDK